MMIASMPAISGVNQNLVQDSASDFTIYISDNQGIIHKVCRMYCDHEEEREDLFQDIVYQLWKSRHAFKGQSKRSTWMYRVALNTAISRFRRENRQPIQQDISEVEFQISEPSRDSDQGEKRKFLHKAIANLTQVERGIIMLYLEDKSYDEIAEIVGITRNHVGVKINRIKTKLKKVVQPHFS